MFILALRSPGFLPSSISAALFEAHWAWWIAAVVLGAAAFYFGWRRANERARRLGMVLLGLALAWFLAATAIDTPAERLQNAHEQLAQAARDRDFDRLVSFLAADFQAPQIGVVGNAVPHDEIAARIKEYGVRQSTFTHFQSLMSGNSADTDVTLRTQTDAGTVFSSWLLRWVDQPGEDWRITRARMTRLNDQPVPEDMLIR